MFLWNVEKCLKIFDKVFVSSDSQEILDLASTAGAIPILRGEDLCGEVPDVPVFRHAFKQMWDCDGIVAVHANNPLIDEKLIRQVKGIVELGVPEVMTCFPMEHESLYKKQANKINGSIRGIARERLENYPDYYKPDPEVLVVDNSIEIETIDDVDLCLSQLQS